MRFYLSLTIVALGVMNAGFVSAKSSPVSGTEKPSRGWHFYEDPELVDEEKQEVPKAQPPSAQPNDKKQPEMVEINSRAGLRGCGAGLESSEAVFFLAESYFV